MSYLPHKEVNPFQAPNARVGDYATDLGDLDRAGEAEMIRREHINHEVSIKTLGTLYYFGAFLLALMTVGIFIAGSGLIPMNLANDPNVTPRMMQGILLGLGVFYLALTVLQGFLGYGLRALNVWARWTVVVITALGLIYLLVVGLFLAVASPIAGLVVLALGGLIPGYIMYLMVCSKGSVVFSPEYKQVIRMSPQVQAQTSLLVKIALGILVLLIVLVVVGAMMNRGG